MKKLIAFLPIALISCGPSQQEVNNKRINDSLIVAMRQKAVTDSVNKINSLRISDSISKEINKQLEAINNIGK